MSFFFKRGIKNYKKHKSIEILSKSEPQAKMSPTLDSIMYSRVFRICLPECCWINVLKNDKSSIIQKTIIKDLNS